MNPFKRSSLDYKIKNISKLANDEKLEPLERAIISIKKFNRMSESEVITPSKICDEMVNLLPEEGLREIVERQRKLLDIASKSGEYAVALYKRLTSKLGYSHNDVKDIIYSIPTSSIAYEFTRRFYEILNLNINNIPVKFNTYDLIKIKDKNGEVDYQKINEILKQNKKFSEINLEDEIKVSDEKVKFGVVIGNPPYQVSDGGARASAKPIYHEYINLSKVLSSSYVSIISPSRWFTGGKGLDLFRSKMIEENKFRTLIDFSDSKECFSGVEVKGGVNYFLWDINYNGECNVKNIYKNNNTSLKRFLKLEDIDIFIRYNTLYTIFKKVHKKENCTFDILVSSRKPFDLDTSTKIDDSKSKNSLKIYGKSKIGYIDEKKIKKNNELINKQKIFITYAYGAGEGFPHQIINKPIIAPLGSVCTETYLSIGPFESEEEVNNAYKYIKTKFFRALVLIAKNSQHATSKTYRFVPMQNFTEKSDINWGKSSDEIDKQLFEKYKLSDEEKKYIKEIIKDM